MSVRVDVDNTRLLAWLSQEPARQGEVSRLFQEEGSILVMSEMRNTVPVRTGFLRESITRQFFGEGSFMVYPTAKYAAFVERGTGPHMIFPVHAKVLRFETAGGGAIFARHVMHPGSPGRFFVQRTAEAVKERLSLLLRAIMESIYHS